MTKALSSAGAELAAARVAFERDNITVEEAARILGCSVPYIRNAVNAGKLTWVLPPGAPDARRTGPRPPRLNVAALQRWYFGQ